MGIVQNPTHTFDEAGEYEVSLHVYNQAGDEIWFSVWNAKDQESAIVVIDDKNGNAGINHFGSPGDSINAAGN